MSNLRGTYYYKVFHEIISISFFLSNSATPLYCLYEHNVIAGNPEDSFALLGTSWQSHLVKGIKEIVVKEKRYEMGMMKVFREDIRIDLTVKVFRDEARIGLAVRI